MSTTLGSIMCEDSTSDEFDDYYFCFSCSIFFEVHIWRNRKWTSTVLSCFCIEDGIAYGACIIGNTTTSHASASSSQEAMPVNHAQPKRYSG